jgi:hypothetical protein
MSARPNRGIQVVPQDLVQLPQPTRGRVRWFLTNANRKSVSNQEYIEYSQLPYAPLERESSVARAYSRELVVGPW